MNTEIALQDLLAGRDVTRPVAALLKAAIDAGMRPYIEARTYRGQHVIVIDGPGFDGLFGCIYVSSQRGTFTRAYLTQGNDGAERRYDHIADVRKVIARYLPAAAIAALPAEVAAQGRRPR